MKILHVAKKYPPALGGDTVVVSMLKKQQQAAGHSVAVVTSNCDEIKAGANVYKLGLKDTAAGLDKITFRRIISLIGLFFSIVPILAKERPDIIHTHSIDMTFFVSFAARFFGIPIIHTFHIVTFYDATQPMLRKKTELWLAKKARLTTATAPNNYDVKRLQAAGLGQTVLLPNGVDLAFWHTASKRGKDDTFIFLTVGRLELQKGYQYLIKATALLAESSPKPFRVIIVGEGSQAEPLRKLAKTLGLEAVISFAGRKTQAEVRDLLARAGAAVFPSLYETTPITLLEAWAARVPAIATPVGILHNAPAGFDAAFIVPPKNQRALMQAMKKCMADEPTRQAVAIKGYRAAKQYDWSRIGRAAEAVYQGTL